MDRLCVEKTHLEKTIHLIDEKNYLHLGNKDASRTELFLFAMALGAKEQKRTPLNTSFGLILESVITKDAAAMAYIHSLAIYDLCKNCEEEKIGDKDVAFQIAQEYANTGFYLLSEWVETVGEEETLWHLYNEVINMQDALSEEKAGA